MLKRFFKKEEIEPTPITIPTDEVQRFATDCLLACGATPKHALIVAQNMLMADVKGHYEYGMHQLEYYVRDIKAGIVDPKANPVILKESTSTAWVDGKNALGPVIAKFCINVAIQKALENGVGLVACRNSNNFGYGTPFSQLCAQRGLIGLCYSNTEPMVVPEGGKEPTLGSNPIALAAPGKEDDLEFEMNTSLTNIAQIEYMRKNKLKGLPYGWAKDEFGNLTTDTDAALKSKCLAPLGSCEIHGSHYGTGLGMMVEVFCGVLSGASYGPFVRQVHEVRKANLGQCFIAINPTCFASNFQSRMSKLMNCVRRGIAADPNKPILVPGDVERFNALAVKDCGGLQYVQEQHDIFGNIAKVLNVRPLGQMEEPTVTKKETKQKKKGKRK